MIMSVADVSLTTLMWILLFLSFGDAGADMAG